MAYVAAAMIIAAVALFVAAPLAGGFFPARRRGASELDRERLEHERGLAVQGLRELEFDREMGKLSDADYESLHEALERRALTAMAALEKDRGAETARGKRPVRRIESARAVGGAPRSSGASINFCLECGTRALAGANFCGECGTTLKPRDRATSRAD
jgi:cytochrome c-type biogenesis protein CcmI